MSEWVMITCSIYYKCINNKVPLYCVETYPMISRNGKE